MIRQILEENGCTWEVGPRSRVFSIMVSAPCGYFLVEVIEKDDDESVDKFLTKGYEILKERGKI